MTRFSLVLIGLFAASGCSSLDHLGKPPSFTPKASGPEHAAMAYAAEPDLTLPDRLSDNASLWSGKRSSLLGDRRAGDAVKLVSGSERAMAELGWEPARSTLAQMIGDAWKWHQSGHYDR